MARGARPTPTPGWRVPALLALVLAGLLAVAACGQGPGAGGSSGKLSVVAAEGFWGSIAGQLGGDRVEVKSIINNPDADPHDYESTPADGRAIAGAGYVILNGAGYDPWAQKLVDANPTEGRRVLDVARLVGVDEGENPHLWYSPTFVRKVIEQVTSDLEKLRSSDASYFESQRSAFESQGLKRYNDLLSEIKQKYAGTPVGATESIFAYLAKDLGLELKTPPSFMDAISEGNDPTAADKSMFDRQIANRQIKVLVFNSQNSTPDVQALVNTAKAASIPVTPVTETPDPPSLTFQEWQARQLQALANALAGRS